MNRLPPSTVIARYVTEAISPAPFLRAESKYFFWNFRNPDRGSRRGGGLP
ncbi:MAG: hypothetical protein IJH79_10140 [Lentisphaeria bacterium]|nr:hypothetical protein [Lentisphaeria bacterium]